MSQLTEQLDLIDKSLAKVSEAFEGQDSSMFPYSIDTEDKQGEIEFWPEGGMSTSDFVDMMADYVLDGEIGTIGYVLDAGLQVVGSPEEKRALSIMQDKAMELLKEYNSSPETDEQPSDEMFYKRSSDEEFKASLLYALSALSKWVRKL